MAPADDMEPEQPVGKMESEESFSHLWDDSESDTDGISTEDLLAEFNREQANTMEYNKRQACKLWLS